MCPNEKPRSPRPLPDAQAAFPARALDQRDMLSDEGREDRFSSDTRGPTTDAHLVELVRTAGVGSAEYRYLERILEEAAMGALKKMGTQRILLAARQRDLQVPLPVPRNFREELPTLCYLAVRAARLRFMQRQVMGGEWTPDGGASLRTFFINNVIYAFVDQYRRYYKNETFRDLLLGQSEDLEGLDCAAVMTICQNADPERTAIDRSVIDWVLPTDDTLWVIVQRLAAGFSQREIAHELGMTEARLNSMLRRFRRTF